MSRSRIKRLRGLSRPRFRLRIDEIGVFYDVSDRAVLEPIVLRFETGQHAGQVYHAEWLEADARFLRRMEAARASIRAGQGIRLEDIDSD